MICTLPLECLLQIGLNFTPTELYFFSSSCKQLLSLNQEEYLWESYTIRDKGFNFKGNEMKWKEMYFHDSDKICKHLCLLTPNLLYTIAEQFKKIVPQVVLCGEAKCNFTFSHLWYCVTPGCNYVGCGRRDSGHALKHHRTTGHPLIIKLNTIELWCYECNQWCGSINTNLIERQKVLSSIQFLGSAVKKDYVCETFIRRQKERELEPVKRQDNIWAIIEVSWYEKWERFLIGDLEDFNEPIDNTPLLTPDGELNRFLLSGYDWVNISLPAWEYLELKYGGGPVIYLNKIY